MDVVGLARRLIDQDTTNPPGKEKGCARVLRDYVEDLHIQDCTVELDEFEPGRASLLVKVGPEVPGLVLSGHIDVVPAGDLAKWRSDPFKAEVRSGRLFGRGAVDMKTAVAAMVGALHSVKATRLRRRLVLAATGDEEIDCDGAKSLLRKRKLTKKDALYCVIGEPTQMTPVRGHKGVSALRVRFMGRSAHASRPELGLNTVEKCAEFIVEVEAWREKMKKERDEDLGITTIANTVTKGGTKSNVIPEYCELEINCRRIPRFKHPDLVRGLKRIGEHVRRSETDLIVKIETDVFTNPLLIPKKHELVKLCEDVSGRTATVVAYGTEAPTYVSAGIPAVVLGPGTIELAHVPNEYIELKEANEAVSMYSELIRRVCV